MGRIPARGETNPSVHGVEFLAVTADTGERYRRAGRKVALGSTEKNGENGGGKNAVVVGKMARSDIQT